MQLLHSLNDHYNNVKTYVLLMELIPPITNFFFFAVQQECQLTNNVLVTNIKNINPIISKTVMQSSITCSFGGKMVILSLLL